MTDDEVRELADDLLREAADAIEFPEHVRELESVPIFTLLLSFESADITYKPHADAEGIVRRCEEEYLRSADKLPPGMGSWLMRALASARIKLLLTNFHHEFSDLLSDLPLVAESQAALLTGFTAADSEEERKRFEPKRGRQHRLGQQLNNREQRFLKLVDERRELGKPPLLLMTFFYETLLPVWREAKKRYTRNRDSKRWQESIALEFSEHELPPGLIERLSKPYEGEPSWLALEHSARLCGVAPDQFRERALRKLLAESKAWKEICTRQEIEGEAVKLEYLREERLRVERRRNSA